MRVIPSPKSRCGADMYSMMIAVSILYCCLFTACSVGEKAVIPKTGEKLMEQVRGEKYYWDSDGREVGMLDGFTKGRARAYAMRELAKLQPRFVEAVPELISQFKKQPDCVTDDHMTIYYRSDTARTLGAIGSPEAIAPLIELLQQRACREDYSWKDNPTVPRWHTNKEPTDWGRRDREGAGPQGIAMGLMLFPREFHHNIEQQLKVAKATIVECELDNTWAVREIDRVIRFLNADKATQAQFTKYIDSKNSWWKLGLLDEDTQAPSVN